MVSAAEEAWLEGLLSDDTLDTRDSLTVEGIQVTLPTSKAGGKNWYRHWQRRVLADAAPDSANADAPERTAFRILWTFTDTTKPAKSLNAVLDGTDLAPLAPLFRVSTRGGKQFPLAFHVLPVRGAEGKGEVDSKGYREETFALLCRDSQGRLDEELVSKLVERFRTAPEELDLAQQTILQRMQPNWSPESKPAVVVPPALQAFVPPLDPVSGELFRRDLRTLLSTRFTSSDFFRSLNLVLALHMGLHQARLAAQLNPQMEVLLEEFRASAAANIDRLRNLDRESTDPRTHPFKGSLLMRAPAAGRHRKVAHGDPVRRAFDQLERDLATLHFNVLLLVRLRQLAASFLVQSGTTEDAAAALVRTPLQLVERMRGDASFRKFMLLASTALSVRFIQNQLGSHRQDEAIASLRAAPTGLHALLDFYRLYNRDSARNPTSSRAHRQGIAMATSLLSSGEYGVIQTRRGLGSFFELGSGLIPLLLLLIIGAERDKVQVAQFWDGLANYGFRLEETEQEHLLGRLKSMGLYERFSDAGEASYVRNLLSVRTGASE